MVFSLVSTGWNQCTHKFSYKSEAESQRLRKDVATEVEINESERFADATLLGLKMEKDPQAEDVGHL